jgi:hypothetical protein
MQLIRRFADGTTLAFGRGLFDDWCVLLTNAKVANYAPRDTEYFTRLGELAAEHGAPTLYRDFVRVYERTSAQLDPGVLDLISEIAAAYSANAHKAELLFALLYATMVAEENKRKAILKKRVKRLAIHQILLENLPIGLAVEWSKGKRWYELDRECRKRGF